MALDSYTLAYIIGNLLSCYMLYKYVTIFFSECVVTAVIERMCYMGYFFAITLVYLSIKIPLVLLFANLVLVFLLTFLYKGSIKKSIFATVIICLSLLCLETIIVFLTSLISINIMLRYEYSSIFGLITARLLSFVFIFTLRGFKNAKSEFYMRFQYWLSLIAVPIFTISILLTVYRVNDVPDVLIVVSTICAFGINILTFYLYEHITSMISRHYENKITKAQERYYENQFLIMKCALESYRIIRHDLKNKLSPLYMLACNGDTKALMSNISELTEICTKGPDFAASGNVAIDSIVNFKLLESADIKSNVNINVPVNLPVSTFDMATVLGNILDNAIEAVALVDDKWLNVDIKFSKGRLIIAVENSYDGHLNVTPDGLGTRKQDKESHGLGLKSIESTIKKYNGVMKIMPSGNQFKTKVLMYM